MKFVRESKSSYYELSECGRYTVCAIGGKDGWRYEAWCGKEQIAVGLEKAEEARAVCANHAGRHDEQRAKTGS